jgi:hypothetical protein
MLRCGSYAPLFVFAPPALLPYAREGAASASHTGRPPLSSPRRTGASYARESRNLPFP